jgi:hypothetical protein
LTIEEARAVYDEICEKYGLPYTQFSEFCEMRRDGRRKFVRIVLDIKIDDRPKKALDKKVN